MGSSKRRHTANGANVSHLEPAVEMLISDHSEWDGDQHLQLLAAVAMSAFRP
jgi:hypothetical protein